MLLCKALVTAGLAISFAPLVINGTAGNDELYGTVGDDVINGKAGDDWLRGDDGDDVINGGPGHDFLLGQDGDDRMHGGPGNDIVRGLAGNDVHIGGDGDDFLELWTDALPVFLPVPPVVGTDEDVGIGGDGDDQFAWCSGLARRPPLPLLFAVESGDATADGGDGYDTILVGVGSFIGLQADYVLEPGTAAGFPWQLRSIATGNTLNFRNIEAIEFVDATVTLP